MRSNGRNTISLTVALAALLMAGPVLAQPGQQGKNKGGSETRTELREQDRREQDRRLERRDRDRDARYDARRQGPPHVPPGWCQGRGNPHNTPENCGYGANRRAGDRYDTRDGNRRMTYEEAHADFHRRHDAMCAERIRRAGTNVREQMRVRSECRAAHEEWHRRQGVPHR